VVEHQLAEAQAAKLRSHPHSFDLPVLVAKQFDATTAGGSTTIPDDEEGHSIGQSISGH
jgi:hypothetical protein